MNGTKGKGIIKNAAPYGVNINHKHFICLHPFHSVELVASFYVR